MIVTLQFLLELLYSIVISIGIGVINLVKWLFPSSFFKSVAGDIVLVTGGGAGIGKIMAKKLAALGAVVVSVDLNEKWNEETVKEIRASGGKAHAYTCDVGDKSAVYALAEKVEAEVGKVVILINNAGVVSGKNLLDTPDDRIELTFKVNVLAHFWTLKAFMPGMIRQRKGHIVSIASLAGLSGSSQLVDYCSSKFAAVGLMDSLSNELDRNGLSDCIKTTVICPFFIKTPLFKGATSKVLPILEPEDVAEQTVQAILTDTEMLLLPWFVKYMVQLKAFLPVSGLKIASQAMGVNNCMDYWTGRE